jgi:uncharacterized protein (UPF0262 family)
MNQKEVSVILDNMVERTRMNPAASGAGAFELYMNIHEMKKEVYTIISEEGEIKEKDFIEIYQKHIKESQRYIVKDLIRELNLKQIGI